MANSENSWLHHLLDRNEAFRAGTEPENLPTTRTPGRYGLVTCMDPRVNPDALGIEPFGEDGSSTSDVRVIRTIGGMAEDRSLVIGTHLAGIREFAFVMHTDCGCSLAKAKIDVIAENLGGNLPSYDFNCFRSSVGEPFVDNLIDYLKAFDDPHIAVQREIESVRAKSFVPDDMILHGLVYDLETANLNVVVDGYS